MLSAIHELQDLLLLMTYLCSLSFLYMLHKSHELCLVKKKNHQKYDNKKKSLIWQRLRKDFCSHIHAKNMRREVGRNKEKVDICTFQVKTSESYSHR